MRNSYLHVGPYAFEAADGDENGDEEIVVPEPEALEAMSDEEIDDLEGRLTEAFTGLIDSNPDDAAAIATLSDIAEGVDSVRSERSRRETAREEARAQADELRTRVLGTDTEPETDESDGDDDAEDETETADATAETGETAAPVGDREPDLIAASAKPKVDVKQSRRINVPLSEIRKRAPQPEPEARLNITAAADVPRFEAGSTFSTLEEVAEAFHERAKSTPLSHSGNTAGPKVASIRREFDHVISRDTPPGEVSRIFQEITNPQSLVAAGGWCAPSEIMYDFFNLTCEDGMIDLPTTGIQRGGIRFPVSPSLADVFDGTFNNTTNPWLWTETDDILAATGGGPTKPCVRVPCPGFEEERLECYGICLTAGNLTDSAYPEATQNQLGLLNSAHFHAINARYIATIAALSTPVATGGIGADSQSAVADLLTYVAWAAVDYRTRLGMCEDDILEIILPIWTKEVIRADLAFRTGVDMLGVTDAQINDWFDVRSVRVQWVNDWQVRGPNQPGGATASINFPAAVQFIIYAAGTFVLGNGLTLDLGVIRDSVLNETNDHTAAWTEECHLIAMRGHLSRLYTVELCAHGRTGANDIIGCLPAGTP